MTQQPEGKINFNGGVCTCDRFANCHDCRDERTLIGFSMNELLNEIQVRARDIK